MRDDNDDGTARGLLLAGDCQPLRSQAIEPGGWFIEKKEPR